MGYSAFLWQQPAKQGSGRRGVSFAETLTVVENALHFPELRRYNSAKMVSAFSNSGHCIRQSSGEHISCFVETLTEVENALHFPELRRYNYHGIYFL